MIRPLLESERNTGAAAAVGLVTAAVAGLALALVLDPAIGLAARATVGLVGLLLAAAGVASSRAFLRPRGGLLVDDDRRRLGLVLTGPGDIWWIPLDRIRGIAVARSEAAGGDVAWVVLLGVEGGPSIITHETTDRSMAGVIAELMAGALDRPIVDELPDGPAPRSGDATVRVFRRVALHGTLGLLGLGASAVGLALLAVVVLKRLVRERLVHRAGLWTHAYEALGRRWGERTVSAPRPRWQVRIRRAGGASLELRGDDGVLVIGSGATTRSRESVSDLAGLPARFA